jgi:Flp pilus assembly protein TadG
MAFSLLKSVLRFAACERGTSAIEFAIGSPVLLIGLVIVTDVGLAVGGRMKLDQAVRSGAEFAMNSVTDETTLEDMVKSAATGAYGNDLNDVNQSDIPTVDVTKTCECPDAAGVSASCDDLCTNDVVPYIYYQFAASQDYQGVFIPDFTMYTEMKVQTR